MIIDDMRQPARGPPDRRLSRRGPLLVALYDYMEHPVAVRHKRVRVAFVRGAYGSVHI
jgi:hypothetical protein